MKDVALYAGIAVAVSLAAFYVLWVLYLAVMNLKRVKDAQGLHRNALVLGTPLLLVGYLLDTILNWTVMTIVLLELPRETTVSARLKRHNTDKGGWRLSVVRWFETILDPFDPSGDHV